MAVPLKSAPPANRFRSVRNRILVESAEVNMLVYAVSTFASDPAAVLNVRYSILLKAVTSRPPPPFAMSPTSTRPLSSASYDQTWSTCVPNPIPLARTCRLSQTMERHWIQRFTARQEDERRAEKTCKRSGRPRKLRWTRIPACHR